MASLLDLLGLPSSAGMPSSMTDEDLQNLQQNQTPFSTLFGLNPSAYRDVASDAASDATSKPDPNYDTDTTTPTGVSQGSPDVTVNDDGTSTDQTPAASAAQSDSSSASDSTPASSNTPTSSTSGTTAQSAQPGFMSKLFSATENPNVSMALMNAGFSMMANSRYGTPWWSAIGSGAQTGMQTYEQLKQQQIQNAMSMYAAQRQTALDQADITAKNATSAATQQATANRANFQKYLGSNPANVTPQSILSNGGSADDIKSLFPTMQTVTGDDGTVYSFNPQGGGLTKIGQTVKTQATPAGTVINQVQPGQNGSPAQVTPVSNVSLTPDQQKQVQTYSDNAVAAKQQADQLGTYMQVVNDPQYQAAQASGLPGKMQAYLRSKGLTSDPSQVIAQTMTNAQLANAYGSIEKSGVSRLDQKTQEAIINGQINWNSADPKTRAAIAQDMYNLKMNEYNLNYRSAQWDGAGLGNSVGPQVTLKDGTVVPAGTNRTDFVGAKSQVSNPMQAGKPATQYTQASSLQYLVDQARSGNAKAQQILAANNYKY
ncbi:hypothetical protein [Burkholderia guangdongensis]|uniref:hypothetical protein n=1 Tax=Burkholderia guangdongensis TaxID=1792500 RepID=UPI0015CE9E6E|nr:hypothetical protein [Burkholderia guangdongensis]